MNKILFMTSRVASIVYMAAKIIIIARRLK